VSNQGRVLTMQGVNNAEAIPIFARENDGGAMTILLGDADHKTWVYRNTATTGWVIDSSVTDRVIAIKGGTGAYNVNGGVEAGEWTHGHAGGSVSGTTGAPSATFNTATIDVNVAFPTTTHTHSFSGTVSVSANTTFRPFAAVGTLQYPDTES